MTDHAKHRLENKLKIHRAMCDITQAELAALVGVTRKSVNSIEKGHFVPSTELALRMARVMKCTVEELFQLPAEEDASEDEPGDDDDLHREVGH